MNPHERWSCKLLTLFAMLASVTQTLAQSPAPAPTRDAAELASALLAGRPGTAVALVGTRQQLQTAGIRTGGSVAEPGKVIFEIGSISKVFTGLLLAQAVERGELKANATLGELLEGEVSFASADTASITLLQLVTHTSCLPRIPSNMSLWVTMSSDPYAGYSRKLLWEMLATHKLHRKGPCKIDYSNLGMGLLGDLLAHKLGKPYEVLVRERITEPLKMTSTAVTLDASQRVRFALAFNGDKPAAPWTFEALAGAGAIRSTANDMLTFTQALVAGRKGPLGAAAERLLTLEQGDMNDGVGYGIFTRRGRYWHNGGTGGYRTMWHFKPDGSDVVVLLSSNGEAKPEPLAESAAMAFDAPDSGAAR